MANPDDDVDEFFDSLSEFDTDGLTTIDELVSMFDVMEVDEWPIFSIRAGR